MSEERPIFPSHLIVQAMRSSGYRNAAYALAELIDNSIQADSSTVRVLISEVLGAGGRRVIKSVAVLDDGSGMSALDLRKALAFGDGTRLGATSGIGKFGMGLPNASVSQAQRVDVWTWQSGLASAIHTHLDVNAIARGEMSNVPVPSASEPPSIWFEGQGSVGASGTLVVWSQIDRCLWKTGLALVENTEFLIGRMYRKFLDNGKVSILMTIFPEESPQQPSHQQFVKPNDPLYLIAPSSTPGEFSDRPMFNRRGEIWEYPFEISFEGQSRAVTLRFSIAPDAVTRPQSGVVAGNTDYGRHAGKNLGVSVVREGRELVLDPNLISTSDVRDRWWGAEIEFGADLDDLMNVPSNKQEAANLTAAAAEFKKYGVTGYQARIEELREAGDPVGALLELVQHINSVALGMRASVREQNARRAVRHGSSEAEEAATSATIRRVEEEGIRGVSDAQTSLPMEARRQELSSEFENVGLSADDASDLATTVLGQGRRYVWLPARIDGGSFFSVSSVAGEIVVKINTTHPAYQHLLSLVEDSSEVESEGVAALRARLEAAQQGLKLLIMAWARYEDEAPSQEARERLEDIRLDWGRLVARFMRESQA